MASVLLSRASKLVSTRPHFSLFVFCLFVLFSTAANSASLKSPWDAPVNRASVDSTTCSISPKASRSLKAQGYYESDKATINAEKKATYLEDTESARQPVKQIVEHADLFRQNGDPKEARCTAGLILAQAQGNALTGDMRGNQAKLFRTWMLNAYATSWLKVRQQSGLDSEARTKIEQWLGVLAEETIEFHKKLMPTIKAHNLRYWAGLAVMNTGVALDRRDLFDWGLAWAKNGVNAIQSDGTLDQELRRKARARKYHLYALEPLVAMAEVAWVNKIDLYSMNDRGIQRLARTALASLSDPTLIEKYTKVKQAKQSINGTNLEWLVPLANRFPDPYYDSFLKKYPTRPVLALGGRLAYPN